MRRIRAHLEDLRIRCHARKRARDVEVALVELTVAPARCLRLIPPVHLQVMVTGMKHALQFLGRMSQGLPFI
jgi:hypothetical protein